MAPLALAVNSTDQVTPVAWAAIVLTLTAGFDTLPDAAVELNVTLLVGDCAVVSELVFTLNLLPVTVPAGGFVTLDTTTDTRESAAGLTPLGSVIVTLLDAV
jgi:hypothetical protein